MIINNSNSSDIIENYGKLEIKKRSMACVGKKIKMLKSPEYSNFHEPLSQEWINGKYQTSKQYVI